MIFKYFIDNFFSLINIYNSYTVFKPSAVAWLEIKHSYSKLNLKNFPLVEMKNQYFSKIPEDFYLYVIQWKKN